MNSTAENPTYKRVELYDNTPEDAVEEYLLDRDVADETLRNLRYRLKRFREWAESTEFDNMASLDGNKANKYRLSRKKDENVGSLTLRNQMRTFRHFVTWCENFNYVRTGISGSIRIEQVDRDDEVRDVVLPAERAGKIREHLRRYHLAKREHVLFALLMQTGMRSGAARSLDVEDWQQGDDGDHYLALHHRPETGTPLKNGKEGGRNVLVMDERLIDAIDRYIGDRRPDVTDEHGRRPLLATRHGRPAKATLQTDIYAVTSCRIVGDCDDDCPAKNKEHASQCPLSVSPHPLRATFITQKLDEGLPKALISGRTNVSVDTLDKHYNKQGREEEYLVRKKYLREWEGVEDMKKFEEQVA